MFKLKNLDEFIYEGINPGQMNSAFELIKSYLEKKLGSTLYEYPEIELFTKSDILAIDKKLGEISLIYGEEVIDTPGVFAALSSELALNNISIRDGVICGSEHIFIINEDDLMKALQSLHGISKWGDMQAD